MVVLTIVAQKNGETVYFEEPIPKVHFMKLLSCSLYNSWHNLERVGQISLKESDELIASLPQGHYTVESLAKELTTSFKYYKNKAKLSIETNKPHSVLKITNWETDSKKQIYISHTLAMLIGSGRTLNGSTYTKKLNSPSTYFIDCDLINKTNNFLNGKRSEIFCQV